MAQTPGGNEGAFNSTTDVVLVAAPAAATQRVVVAASGKNKDSAAVTINLFKKKGASTYTIGILTVPSLENFILVGIGGIAQTVVLDATDETLEADLSAAVAATQPDFQAAYVDKTA